MAESLYPKDEYDEDETEEEYEDDETDEEEDTEYHWSLKWDPVVGDFVRDNANRLVKCEGREAYIVWCLKSIVTERDAHLAYVEEVTGNDIGVEFNKAMQQVDRPSVEAYLESTIKEALEINPRTEWVGNFVHTWEGDDIHISFQIKGKEWDDVISINT